MTLRSDTEERHGPRVSNEQLQQQLDQLQRRLVLLDKALEQGEVSEDIKQLAKTLTIDLKPVADIFILCHRQFTDAEDYGYEANILHIPLGVFHTLQNARDAALTLIRPDQGPGSKGGEVPGRGILIPWGDIVYAHLHGTVWEPKNYVPMFPTSPWPKNTKTSSSPYEPARTALVECLDFVFDPDHARDVGLTVQFVNDPRAELRATGSTNIEIVSIDRMTRRYVLQCQLPSEDDPAHHRRTLLRAAHDRLFQPFNVPWPDTTVEVAEDLLQQFIGKRAWVQLSELTRVV